MLSAMHHKIQLVHRSKVLQCRGSSTLEYGEGAVLASLTATSSTSSIVLLVDHPSLISLHIKNKKSSLKHTIEGERISIGSYTHAERPITFLLVECMVTATL